MLTKKAAVTLAWPERGEEFHFIYMHLLLLFLAAVNKNPFTKNCDDDQVEKYVKRWFQLSGDRDGGRKYREEKKHKISGPVAASVSQF
jgi:hypothetical protein